MKRKMERDLSYRRTDHKYMHVRAYATPRTDPTGRWPLDYTARGTGVAP